MTHSHARRGIRNVGASGFPRAARHGVGMNWIMVLLATFAVLGFARPGRLGSTYVMALVASVLVVGWAYLKLGS